MAGRNSAGPGAWLPLVSVAVERVVELYRRDGAHPDWVAAEVARQLDGLAASPPPAAGQMVVLLRMRDLQRWVESDMKLRSCKLGLLEALLTPRTPAARWAAARGHVAANLGIWIGGEPEARRETLKRELSREESAVGGALRLCSLVHLESSGEVPPPGWSLRFKRGRFPQHHWERRDAVDSEATWLPETSLARWTYLAADLVEFDCLSQVKHGDSAWDGGWGGPGRGRKEAPAPAVGSLPPVDQTFCRIGAEPDALAQLPLLPTRPETLLTDLFRHAWTRLGAEGVRQTALVLAACAGGRPEAPLTLDFAELGRLCGPAGARERQERARTLDRAIHLLAGVTVQRVSEAGNEAETARVHTRPLLSVLEWEDAAPAPLGAGSPPRRERLTLRPDALLRDFGYALGEPVVSLPAPVVALSPREHPFALVLAVGLRARGAEARGRPVTCGAAEWLRECGAELPDGLTPALADALKRDLQRLQELGIVGRWRLRRNADSRELELSLETAGLGQARLGRPARRAGRAVAQAQRAPG
jgi:hypothetical protein